MVKRGISIRDYTKLYNDATNNANERGYFNPSNDNTDFTTIIKVPDIKNADIPKRLFSMANDEDNKLN